MFCLGAIRPTYTHVCRAFCRGTKRENWCGLREIATTCSYLDRLRGNVAGEFHGHFCTNAIEIPRLAEQFYSEQSVRGVRSGFVCLNGTVVLTNQQVWPTIEVEINKRTRLRVAFDQDSTFELVGGAKADLVG